MNDPTNTTEPSEYLVDELFNKIQGDQGRAFVCDGFGELSESEYVTAIRDIMIPATQSSLRKLRAFVKKYKHLIK